MISCLTKNSDDKLQITITDIHTSEKKFFDLNIPIDGDYYFHQSKYFCCIIDYIDYNCYIFNKCENFELINTIKVEAVQKYEVDFSYCNKYIIIYYPHNCNIYNILTTEIVYSNAVESLNCITYISDKIDSTIKVVELNNTSKNHTLLMDNISFKLDFRVEYMRYISDIDILIVQLKRGLHFYIFNTVTNKLTKLNIPLLSYTFNYSYALFDNKYLCINSINDCGTMCKLHIVNFIDNVIFKFEEEFLFSSCINENILAYSYGKLNSNVTSIKIIDLNTEQIINIIDYNSCGDHNIEYYSSSVYQLW